MKKLSILIFSIILFSGCKFEEPVTFKKIDEVKVLGIKDGMVNLSAIAVFYNPNEIEGKLKDVNIDVGIDDKVLATITQSEQLKIGKNAEFQIPINIKFAMEDAQEGILNNLLNILAGNKIKLHFLGEIKVSTFIITQTVEVDYYEEVKLQF